MLPERIGRFSIHKLLGRGERGPVYLGYDGRLGREVALRTLAPADGGMDRDAILRAARIAARLQHPNIVALHEAGDWQGGVYLALEYVRGGALSERLPPAGCQGAKPPLAVPKALAWVLGVLDGLEYAHGQGVVHGAVAACNVLIDGDGEGIARLTDFRIALPGADAAGQAPAVAGVGADLVAAGLLMFELLTGASAVPAESGAAGSAAEPGALPLPSTLRPSLDRGLDAIFARATAAQAKARYPSAAAMAAALREFLGDDGAAESRRLEAAAEQTTLKFLLRKISRNADFPAVSAHISEINRMAASDSEATVNELANVVLKDYSLTNKLLRLVNSSYYGQFGGKVNTVSHAITIVGFQRIRGLALGLVLFEQIRARPQASDLLQAARASFISAAVARQLAAMGRHRDEELYFIGALLHDLGRLMVIYYLPDEYLEIGKLTAQKGMEEEVAARAVLGVGFDALGRYIGRVWNFPSVLLSAMQPLAQGPVAAAQDEAARVRGLADFANGLTRLLERHAGDVGAAPVLAHLARFKRVAPVAPEQLTGMVQAALKEAAGYIQVPLGWAAAAAAPEPTDAVAGEAAGEGADRAQRRAGQLLNGVNDITGMLIAGRSLNQILIATLEVAYSSLELGRALLLIRAVGQDRLVTRFAFGKDVDRLLNRFAISVEGAADAVSRALASGADLVVADSAAPGPAPLPDWYPATLGARSFAFLPLRVDGKLIGALYLDCERAGALGPGEMLHMQTLRNQAVLAFRQARGG